MPAVTGTTGVTPVEHEPADANLIAEAAGGDRVAFGRLHDRYAPVVHGILLARVPPDAADDLVQDIFLHAMRKLPTLRDPAAFGSWLGAITRNFAVRFYRRRRLFRSLPGGLADERPRREDDGSQAREALAAIRALPESYRDTLMLRLVEGLTGPEIAARTGLTPGSVRVNLHRGMTLLRCELQRKERGP